MEKVAKEQDLETFSRDIQTDFILLFFDMLFRFMAFF